MKDKKILVTAHAGCMNTTMDSLDSIEMALEYQADIIEVDVRFTKDLIPVLSHDEVDECNIDKYVTLEQVLELVSKHNDMSINLDMKEYHGLGIVENLVEKYNMTKRVFFTGMEFDSAYKVRDLKINIPYFINYELDMMQMNNDEYLNKLCNYVKEVRAIGINLNYRFLSESLIEVFHKSDLLVSAWTVDHEQVMKYLIEMGVDSITTKEVELLLKNLGRVS